MTLEEYNKIKNLSYQEYCRHLQKKYGIPPVPYFNRNWNKNRKNVRTSEGLFVHHVFEDHAIMLGNPKFACSNPYEWQLPENLVYCDYLEHLLLHIMICEHPAPDCNRLEAVGIGGIVNFIVPELNDLYSGWVTKEEWRLKCHNKVVNDKDAYLVLIARFKHNCSNHPLYREECLFSSFNDRYGLWELDKNIPLFEEIMKL